ncbi:hypothetical protein SAMN05216528_103654, partial [Enterocloster clostridioformis]
TNLFSILRLFLAFFSKLVFEVFLTLVIEH